MTQTIEAKKTETTATFEQQLGDRLRRLRLLRGLSQAELGKHINVSRVAVGYIEQGRRTPSLHTLRDIAELYSLSLSELVAIEDEDTGNKSRGES